MFTASLAYIDHSCSEQENEMSFNAILDRLNYTTEEEVEQFSYVYSGLITLLKALLRINTMTVRQEIFLADLQDIG